LIPSTLEAEDTLDDDIKCASTGITTTPSGYNCEPMNDDFQVLWIVEDDIISFELIGRIEDIHSMGFGPSGDSDETNMDGSDPVIVDHFEKGFRARDYYMISRGQ
jgi:hypothetical protein